MILSPFRNAALAAASVITMLPALTSSAFAEVQLSARGAVGYLKSYHLQPGDDEEFRAFLDAPRAQPLRVIYMDSHGGNPGVGMAIGRMIRERGLDTGYDAARGGRCISACTAMYLGGVHRYYLHGERVRDGVETKHGLGFHPPRDPRPGHEEMMNGYYQEMGAPGASEFRYRLYPRDRLDEPFQGVGPRGRREMYYTGSRSAIRSGVATSTSAPPGLRD